MIVEARTSWPARRRGTARVRAMVDLLRPGMTVWDLCCDRGHIGLAALEHDPAADAVFVDRAMRTVDTLERALARNARVAGRYRVICADVRQLELPAPPVNFVIAGVSTKLIAAFLQRVVSRSGDRVICNTFQDPSGFQARAVALGFVIEQSLEVDARSGSQGIWVLGQPAGASRAEGTDHF